MSDTGETVGKQETLDALHRLYVDSLPRPQRDTYDALPITTDPRLDLKRACEVLASSDWVDRLQKWDAVATAVQRRPELLGDDDTARLMAHVINPSKDVGSPANQQVVDHLRQVPHPVKWRSFYTTAVQPEHPAGDEVRLIEAGKPSCNEVVDPIDGATTIVSQFSAHANHFERLAEFANPRNWARLGSLYWESMEPLVLRGTDSNYTGTFREVVQLLPGLTITVYLGIRYSKTKTTALTEYWAAPPRGNWRNNDVEIDEGCVLVTTETESPEGLGCKVYSTKTIRFVRQELNTFPGLACDNEWADLMIRMALPEVDGRQPTLSGPLPEPSAVDDSNDPGGAWVQAAEDLANRQVVMMRGVSDALRRGQWSGQLDDALSVGSGIVNMWTAGATAWRECVRDLAKGGPA